jgi:hypothetical protein
VARILPDEAVEDDAGVDALHVVALVHHPAPPGLLDVVAELDAEWAVVPGAAQPAVDLRGGKDEAAPLRERHDGFDVRCRQVLSP